MGHTYHDGAVVIFRWRYGSVNHGVECSALVVDCRRDPYWRTVCLLAMEETSGYSLRKTFANCMVFCFLSFYDHIYRFNPHWHHSLLRESVGT